MTCTTCAALVTICKNWRAMRFGLFINGGRDSAVLSGSLKQGEFSNSQAWFRYRAIPIAKITASAEYPD